MHLPRVGFGFGWLYSLHGCSACFGFPSVVFVPSHIVRTPKRILVSAPLFYSDFVSILGRRLLYFLASSALMPRLSSYVLSCVVDVCVILLR